MVKSSKQKGSGIFDKIKFYSRNYDDIRVSEVVIKLVRAEKEV